jgi:hypothetical protein
MSVITGPALVIFAVVVGLVAAGWLVSSWFGDHYAVPITPEAEPAVMTEPDLDV